MGYYIRVLGTQNPDIRIEELIEALTADGLTAKFNFESTEEPNKWTRLDILNQNCELLAQLEKSPVIKGGLGQEELNEFREEIKDYKPVSAVKWLSNYFDKIKIIYAFQLLNAAFEDNNFEIVSNIQTEIWNKTSGIFQADNEGYSNEDGYHILWQFPETAEGEWNCAIRNWFGKWENFIMDLGDITQRKEFQSGKVPKASRRI